MKILKKKIHKEDYLDLLLDELKEINETLSGIEQYCRIVTWDKESMISDMQILKEKNKKLNKQLKEEKCKKQ